MHIADAEQRRWVHEQIERAGGNYALNVDEKSICWKSSSQADGLERYLHTKYVGQKRFSLEGGDSLIPLVDELLNRGGNDGLKDLVIGMAHRGRLNVLVNLLGKAPQKLFAEFEGKFDHVDDPAHSGDVKYHMGFSADVQTAGHTVHVVLAFNPSHLEIVNPVVAGSVRARQTHRRDVELEQVLPILIHGDAALAGQGVNMELFNMSQARGFGVGGTIHVVVNNQVGFTISNPHDCALDPVLHRCRQDGRCAGFPCEWRRSGSRVVRGASRLRLPQEIQARRGDRSRLLPTAWPQRSR